VAVAHPVSPKYGKPIDAWWMALLPSAGTWI
jgi:hypothetical protein